MPEIFMYHSNGMGVEWMRCSKCGSSDCYVDTDADNVVCNNCGIRGDSEDCPEHDVCELDCSRGGN